MKLLLFLLSFYFLTSIFAASSTEEAIDNKVIYDTKEIRNDFRITYEELQKRREIFESLGLIKVEKLSEEEMDYNTKMPPVGEYKISKKNNNIKL
jgi:hypothetical protein